MIAELPAQALMGSLPTLLGRYQLTKGEAYAAAREARKVPLLTKERGVALQLELMATYSSPAFQKQLHELGRTLGWLGQHLAVALLVFGTRHRYRKNSVVSIALWRCNARCLIEHLS